MQTDNSLIIIFELAIYLVGFYIISVIYSQKNQSFIEIINIILKKFNNFSSELNGTIPNQYDSINNRSQNTMKTAQMGKKKIDFTSLSSRYIFVFFMKKTFRNLHSIFSVAENKWIQKKFGDTNQIIDEIYNFPIRFQLYFLISSLFLITLISSQLISQNYLTLVEISLISAVMCVVVQQIVLNLFHKFYCKEMVYLDEFSKESHQEVFLMSQNKNNTDEENQYKYSQQNAKSIILDKLQSSILSKINETIISIQSLLNSIFFAITVYYSITHQYAIGSLTIQSVCLTLIFDQCIFRPLLCSLQAIVQFLYFKISNVQEHQELNNYAQKQILNITDNRNSCKSTIKFYDNKEAMGSNQKKHRGSSAMISPHKSKMVTESPLKKHNFKLPEGRQPLAPREEVQVIKPMQVLQRRDMSLKTIEIQNCISEENTIDQHTQNLQQDISEEDITNVPQQNKIQDPNNLKTSRKKLQPIKNAKNTHRNLLRIENQQPNTDEIQTIQPISNQKSQNLLKMINLDSKDKSNRCTPKNSKQAKRLNKNILQALSDGKNYQSQENKNLSDKKGYKISQEEQQRIFNNRHQLRQPLQEKSDFENQNFILPSQPSPISKVDDTKNSSFIFKENDFGKHKQNMQRSYVRSQENSFKQYKENSYLENQLKFIADDSKQIVLDEDVSIIQTQQNTQQENTQKLQFESKSISMTQNVDVKMNKFLKSDISCIDNDTTDKALLQSKCNNMSSLEHSSIDRSKIFYKNQLQISPTKNSPGKNAIYSPVKELDDIEDVIYPQKSNKKSKRNKSKPPKKTNYIEDTKSPYLEVLPTLQKRDKENDNIGIKLSKMNTSKDKKESKQNKQIQNKIEIYGFIHKNSSAYMDENTLQRSQQSVFNDSNFDNKIAFTNSQILGKKSSLPINSLNQSDLRNSQIDSMRNQSNNGQMTEN